MPDPWSSEICNRLCPRGKWLNEASKAVDSAIQLHCSLRYPVWQSRSRHCLHIRGGSSSSFLPLTFSLSAVSRMVDWTRKCQFVKSLRPTNLYPGIRHRCLAFGSWYPISWIWVLAEKAGPSPQGPTASYVPAHSAVPQTQRFHT